MAQDTIPAPEVTSGSGYGMLYATYLHSASWVLRKAVSALTGTGESFDQIITLDTPSLGEGHVKISICLPKASPRLGPKPLIIVAEGGGFVLGQPSDGEHIVRALSDGVDAVIISVDYAKAPRYPYPHALLQMYETILWATSPQAAGTLGLAIDPSRVAIMGNSAGGNLTASLTLLLSFTSGSCAQFRKRLPESFKITAQVLLYPSLACNQPYLDRYNAADDTVRVASLPVWAASLMEASYLPPYVDKKQIFIAPVDVEVDLLRSLHLPSTMCITAGMDCLKLETQEYTRKLREAEVDVVSHEYPDAVHGFSHHKKDFKVDRESCWEHIRVFLSERLAI